MRKAFEILLNKKNLYHIYRAGAINQYLVIADQKISTEIYMKVCGYKKGHGYSRGGGGRTSNAV